jgi:hypothetical protein
MPTIVENTEPTIQPQTMTTGPPVYRPKENKREQPLTTATAVKQNEKFIKALNPRYNSAL